MINTQKKHIRSKAEAFVNYAHAGKADTVSVSDGYYTPQRIRHIGKLLNALLKHNSFDGCTQEDYEIAYIRLCDHQQVGQLVVTADWKRLIGLIAHRVHFCTKHSLPLTGLTVLTLKRLWKIVLALRRGE